jgi:hypothetical protein
METPQSMKHIAKPVSTRVDAHSAQRSLVKVESGINGLLPTSWAPPIYSVSLLTRLRCVLPGNGLLRLGSCSLVPRSHLHRSRSLLEGKHLALAILARSMAEFLITAEFKHLRRCANTDSCVLVFYDTTKNHRRQL